MDDIDDSEVSVMTKKKMCLSFQNKESKAQLVLVILLLLGCLCVFRKYLFGDSLMVFNDIGSDTWQQYIQQYATVVNHLLEGNYTFWDFNNGLGTNMLSMNLFDPSLMCIYLLGVLFGTSKMVYFLSWMQVIRVLVAGFVFYRFLSMFSYRVSVKVPIAFAYGFNGFLMVWGQHYQFGMVTIYFPLLLIFGEKYIRRAKGSCGFPVMVAVSCIYSVYQTYMCLIVVGFYLIFRLWMIEELKSKERFKIFFKGCLQILLGIGMGCAVFLPTAYMMLNVSGRIGGVETGFLAWLKEYLTPYPRAYYESGIMRLFSSNLQECYGLSDGRYEKYLNYYEDPVLYVSNTVMILMIQMFMVLWRTKTSIRKKAAVYMAAVLSALMLLLPIGGCVFNAFSYVAHRYTFVFMPFILLAGAWMWEYLLDNGETSIVGLIITAYLLERVFHLGYDQTLFTSYKKNILVLANTSAVTLIVLAVYPFLRKRKTVYLQKIAMMVMSLALMVNVISEGYTCFNERVVLRKQDTPLEAIEEVQAANDKEYYSKDQERFVLSTTTKVQNYFREMYSEHIQDALKYLEEKDDTFYRVEKDFSSGTVAMDALSQGYYGISTYNSTLNKNVKEFLDTCCVDLYAADRAHVQFWEDVEDNHLAAYFGVKYLLSKNPELNEKNYKLLKQFGDVYVYENMKDANVAKFYETIISEESFKKLCTEDTREELLGNVLAVKGGTEVNSRKKLQKIIQHSGKTESDIVIHSLKEHSKVTGEIHAAKDGYIMFMIPFEQGWSLFIDGKETEILRGDLGFIACKVEEGNHNLELTFETPMLKEGIIISILFWGIYGFGIYRTKKRKRQISA